MSCVPARVHSGFNTKSEDQMKLLELQKTPHFFRLGNVLEFVRHAMSSVLSPFDRRQVEIERLSKRLRADAGISDEIVERRRVIRSPLIKANL